MASSHSSAARAGFAAAEVASWMKRFLVVLTVVSFWVFSVRRESRMVFVSGGATSSMARVEAAQARLAAVAQRRRGRGIINPGVVTGRDLLSRGDPGPGACGRRLPERCR